MRRSCGFPTSKPSCHKRRAHQLCTELARGALLRLRPVPSWPASPRTQRWTSAHSPRRFEGFVTTAPASPDVTRNIVRDSFPPRRSRNFPSRFVRPAARHKPRIAAPLSFRANCNSRRALSIHAATIRTSQGACATPDAHAARHADAWLARHRPAFNGYLRVTLGWPVARTHPPLA